MLIVKLTNEPQAEAVRAVLSLLGTEVNVKIEKSENISMDLSKDIQITSSTAIARHLTRLSGKAGLYGTDPIQRTQIDHWLEFSTMRLPGSENFEWNLSYLDNHISMATYLVGESLTLADVFVLTALKAHGDFQKLLKSNKASKHVVRYYNFISEQVPVSVDVTTSPVANNNNKKKERKTEGKFVDLPDAEMGKVVVRFPPEASGYLHIGHAKASLLNQYYQQMFEGKLILRFDDTNPEKEDEEFEKVILEDVAMLGIKPDIFTRTSDHFDRMLDLCTKMINEGRAYADDTDPEVMKKEREERQESKNRNNTVEKNLSMWQEMKSGTDYGLKCCIRAKLDMASDNGCLRDPTMYRCKKEEHVVTGNKYKVYPTYDFACPIVDSVEGVTHALRTMEYHDRDEQYYWFIDALDLRKPVIWEFSRLNLMNTVMSKRKLTWLVNEKIVDGWDDPRFPTVRGVMRRGMTVEGLKEFVIAQGSSRAVTTMEWDKIWAFNKRVIDPIAPRYVALQKDSVVPVFVRDAVKECKEVQKHPKEASVGMKSIWCSTKVLIDGADAAELSTNEVVTFINWGNLTIEEVKKDESGKVVSVQARLSLDNKDFKNTQKLTWLSEVEEAPLTPTVCYTFDHIISRPVLAKNEDFKDYINFNSKTETMMLGDPELRNLKKGDIIQLQRRGFFICDAPCDCSRHSCRESPCVLFNIPDGHTKEMPVAGSKFKARNDKKNSNVVETSKESSNKKKEETKQVAQSHGTSDLDDAIAKQGDLIRDLKTSKASKVELEPHIKKLLDLKKQYKETTGQDWKPSANPPVQQEKKVEVAEVKKVVTSEPEGALNLDDAIAKQGDLIRQLKTSKASKVELEPHVKKLLDLKKQYKDTTGQDWKPSANPPVQQEKKVEVAEVKKVVTSEPEGALKLNEAITEQGNVVRQLKASKAPKAEVDESVAKLKKLKAEYETLTGVAWAPSAAPASKQEATKVTPSANQSKSGNKSGDKQKKKEEKPENVKPQPNVVDVESREIKKVTRLGMEVGKQENFSEWYSQVITKSEMIEYYDVSGCYVLRPWAFGIWEKISAWFDGEIKKMGFENCYFPMFVSASALETEKDHIADFSPEVAWVTKSGTTELAEPIAIRPTSETVMYPSYAKWVQSHRDLPIKLNQWCNVVRWEFKHPQPFLRTREFLWQEGHSAHNNFKDAEEEVYQILELYSQVYQDLLAVPVIKGQKTEKEKFAGGDFTTTIEAYIPASGRGIQAATSHHLGQNFSKMFEISFEDTETGEKKYAYQNSWGLTTRSIGVLVMVHGDDKGLVLPPRIAQIQVVIVPCGITVQLEAGERQKLLKECNNITSQLNKLGVRVKFDSRDNYTPGWKFNHWELKGVPIRIEIGPKDLKSEQFVAVRRDTGVKSILKLSEVTTSVVDLLDDIQKSMFEKAKKERDSNVVVVNNFNDFCSKLDDSKLLLAPFCGGIECEDQIKKLSARDVTGDGTVAMGAKGLCIPFEQPTQVKEGDKCIRPDCPHTPKNFTLFGRSY